MQIGTVEIGLGLVQKLYPKRDALYNVMHNSMWFTTLLAHYWPLTVHVLTVCQWICLNYVIQLIISRFWGIRSHQIYYFLTSINKYILYLVAKYKTKYMNLTQQFHNWWNNWYGEKYGWLRWTYKIYIWQHMLIIISNKWIKYMLFKGCFGISLIELKVGVCKKALSNTSAFIQKTAIL